MLTLNDFYKELQQWLDEGKPEHPVFKPWNALCYTLTKWQDYHRLPMDIRELTSQFEAAGLHPIYPFNPRGDFWLESSKDNNWNNQARLQWIKNHSL